MRNLEFAKLFHEITDLIEKSDVINTWPLDRLLAWTHKTRPRAA